MVSFHEALELLLENTPLLETESCRLENVGGRVLRRAIAADRSFPPFDRVMMDGFALRSADWTKGLRSYRITGSAPAGATVTVLADESGTCVEVMTGAPCPTGADLIIPVEDVVEIRDDRVDFAECASHAAGKFIHRAGSDAAAGQVLLEPGCLLGSREIGVAASCGAGWLEVSRLPRIAVIATGDELVPIDHVPSPYQIRQSNAHSLAAALTDFGHSPNVIDSLKDEISVSRPTLETVLAAHDWLVLTGAVSKGSRDFVPTLLHELGCRLIFHGVAQRPGKPAGCWLGPGGQLIVALPGNPVSALTGLHTLVFPALDAAAGLRRKPKRLVVMDDSSRHVVEFTRHLPVALGADGRAQAAATGNSGDFIGLLASDGFVTLPPRGGTAVAFPYTPWR